MALPRPALLLFLLVVLTCGQEQCSSLGLCDLTAADRHARIHAAVQAISGRKTLQNTKSSYRRALVWLRGQEQCSSLGLCDLTAADRHARIHAAVQAISGRKTLQNTKSSYRRALVWLRDHDRSCPDASNFVQRYVLAVLYFAAGGINWSVTVGGVEKSVATEGLYLNYRHECTWFGVECDNAGRVTKLLMEGINMVGRIPHALSHLDHLTELDFGKNKLRGPVHERIGELSNLVRLDLDLNELTGDFGKNKLRGPVHERIGELSNLVRLDLDLNELTGTLPDELFHLEKLEWMDLDSNQFTGTVPAGIGALRNVELMSLYNNQFTGAVPTGSQLQHMDKLEYLYLDGNDLTGTTDLCREMDDTV
eukprot:CAMPEP_0194348262 /NCGR_PEP_ID=MMETSP0171-20130528/106437_1 /TAXON_ID=218684 /ORGANISM="Corethron pennatum, Strain L29A3" /LENGTH=364 /DNA_ID=CAMNT_0039115589 /DNA_START=226 /DNA_END=1316 /DNA_ORIENTATION=-